MPTLSDRLVRCLDDLESRIDEAQELDRRQAWIDFLDGRCRSEIFAPPARRASPPGIAWPKVSINAGIADHEAMLLREFDACQQMLNGGRMPMTVRSNYGTGILPSLFGCELFMMADELETLPTSRPLGSAEAVRRLLAAGVPALDGGLGGRVFETAEWYLEVFRRYPRIAQHVTLYHPDVQGPIDVAEVVWGSDIFYAFVDTPDLLRDFLDLVTATYSAFMRRWFALAPSAADGYAAHWTLMHKGRLMLRNDSLMNLSPQAYEEFVRPCDQRLFDEFGGGAIHFCGRGDHFIAAMSQMPGLTAIQLSQPHLNNMETICRHTIDRGLPLLNFSPAAAAALQSAGRPLRGRVQC